MHKKMSPINTLHLSWQCKIDRSNVVRLLQNDTVLICSTDTIYGFLGPLTKVVHQTISDMKGQRENKPYLILIKDVNALNYFVDVSQLSKATHRIIDNCWPGPLTIIFRARKDLPSHITSEQGTIAIRCPDHQGLQHILSSFDGLFSTSANKSNQPAPTQRDEINPTLLAQVAAIVDDNLPSIQLHSTIIDCTEPASPRLLREGAYPLTDLETYYGKPFKK